MNMKSIVSTINTVLYTMHSMKEYNQHTHINHTALVLDILTSLLEKSTREEEAEQVQPWLLLDKKLMHDIQMLVSQLVEKHHN